MNRPSTSIDLIRPATAWRESFLAGLAEIDNEHDRRTWTYLWNHEPLDFPERDFSGYVRMLLQLETQAPPDFVCSTVYWALCENEVVGRIVLRHSLNDFLAKFGGHIGYIVRPSFRRQGIATEMLRRVLQTDRARLIGDILITCDEGNIASERTILRNGGVYENTLEVAPGRPPKKRFWVRAASTPRM